MNNAVFAGVVISNGDDPVFIEWLPYRISYIAIHLIASEQASVALSEYQLNVR